MGRPDPNKLVSQKRWHGREQALAEILAEPLPQRRPRRNPRVIKRKMSNWAVKRPEHRKPPTPPTPAEDAITLLAA
jgi:hypothetical protein